MHCRYKVNEKIKIKIINWRTPVQYKKNQCGLAGLDTCIC